jgi:hypothetical protein
MVGAVVMISNEGNALDLGCDNRQYSDKPVVPNAISVDLTVPYGYLCHFLESKGKEISVQKAAYTSNATVSGPLVKGICNWRIDFVYYGPNGNEYMRDKGETVTSCDQGASRVVTKSKTLSQYGSACVELIIDGEARLTQCHTMKE